MFILLTGSENDASACGAENWQSANSTLRAFSLYANFLH